MEKLVPVIAFDIDNTILSGDPANGWHTQKPIPGRIETLTRLRKRGVFIVMCTARPDEYFAETKAQLIANKVPFNAIIMGKPNVPKLIDDKAYNVDRFDEACSELLSLDEVGL